MGGVPSFSAKQEDEARRLITLVDVCYDWQARLVLHAHAPRDALFSALSAGAGADGGGAPRGELQWMVRRCLSRLAEMTGERGGRLARTAAVDAAA